MLPHEIDEVAIDLRQASGRPTGVGRYLAGLANAAAESEALRVRAYARAPLAIALHRSVDLMILPDRGLSWHLSVWRDLRSRGKTPFLSTSFILAQLPGIRALPVILDLTSFMFPKHHTFRTRLAERVLLPRAARRWPVITCTATTAADLRSQLGPSIRATVVPPTLPAPGQETANPDTREPYVVFVGTLEPRKNIAVVLEAVHRLRASGRPIRIKLVGNLGWHTRQIRDVLDRFGSEGVEQTGYVGDEERDRIYAGATAMLLPSIYEGFGLPLLEAMQRGIPCICSTAPALVEVAAGAAVHVSPADAGAWSDTIAGVLDDASWRRSLILRGLRRAADFTPQATSEALLRTVALLNG